MDTGFRALATIGVWGCGSYYAFLSNKAFYEALANIRGTVKLKGTGGAFSILPAFAMVICTAIIWNNGKSFCIVNYKRDSENSRS